MLIKDHIYGEFEITEPILIDLINCPSVQRLKGISQMGLPEEYWHCPVYSRYDHSIGVMLLLRLLGADTKEQVAGLLHDVSHTAFSHIIDWVIGDPALEDYQDSIHSEFISNSEIPEILGRYGYSVKEICDLESFSLLEQHIPELCADRIDYTLRELDDNELVVKSLSVFDGRIIFDSLDAAESFSASFSRLQREHWGAPQSKARYHIMADILKRAISQKIISFEDLNRTDAEVLELLHKAEDKEVAEGLLMLKKGFDIEESSEGITLKRKFRYIDPLVRINGGLVRLSDKSDSHKACIEEERNRESAEVILKLKR